MTLSDQRSTSDDETKFMDRVLVAWSSWAHVTSKKLGYPACGDIWGLYKPPVDRRELKLTDDQLVLVDQAVAKLPWRTGRKVLFVEYWLEDPQEVKAKRFNQTRYTYRRKLDILRYDLYQSLMPDVEAWRLAVL